jgi:hypothetical protein
VPRQPGREPTFRTYPVEQLLVHYWLGPHDTGRTYRCVACGTLSTEWPEVPNNWGAVVVLEADPREEPVGEICPVCADRLWELYRDRRPPL